MWSGAARSTPINDKTDRKKPSAWRTGTRKTRRSVNAVSIAQSENVFGAPGRGHHSEELGGQLGELLRRAPCLLEHPGEHTRRRP